MTSPSDNLLERLRLKEHRGLYMPGGGTIDAEGKGTMWGGEKIMEYRNPDGPEAARIIEEMATELEAQMETVERLTNLLSRMRDVRNGLTDIDGEV